MPVDRTPLHPLIRDILTSRVYDVARETPLDLAPRLSERLGATVFLKREDLQLTFSFKLRGAYNRIAHLTEAERSAGIITASAGNHAQGVAFSARHLGLRAVIVMPVTTPAIKVKAVRDLGAEVVLSGDTYSDAASHCVTLARGSGMTVIHPFDDLAVIAGQGTVGMEIVRQAPDTLDAVFVPVGGGGLIAGVAAYVKACLPSVRIIGVEPYEADAMYRSLASGSRVQLDQVGIFADGVAVRQVGQHTFTLCQDAVDEVVRVTNDEICAAIKDVFDDTRSIMEPSGALSVAGIKAWIANAPVAPRSVVAILSGANMNFDRLRFVAERAELGEAREMLLGVVIPEQAGAFRQFCSALGRRVITEFHYRLSGRAEAHIFVGLTVSSREENDAVTEGLRARGYQTFDLTQDEVAKLHVRHMVGGRAPGVQHERLCRFQFPERPGALMQFLDALGGRWNISLFHYRNHGSDFGRVLAGFEVADADMPTFMQFLTGLGYEYAFEEGNVAYGLFLR